VIIGVSLRLAHGHSERQRKLLQKLLEISGVLSTRIDPHQQLNVAVGGQGFEAFPELLVAIAIFADFQERCGRLPVFPHKRRDMTIASRVDANTNYFRDHHTLLLGENDTSMSTDWPRAASPIGLKLISS
jgi:hypothetical protein